MASKPLPSPTLVLTDEGSSDSVDSPAIRALDMTEQNYEEQDAEAAAAMQGIQQDPSLKEESQPQNDEEPEDTFHIDLD